MTTLEKAPDATVRGPSPTTSAEYKLPASIDPDVLGDRMTELWARVYRPATLPATPAPLIVVLHGNHATCGIGAEPRVDRNCKYTDDGTCPAGYTVVPSHEGYGYVADHLASWGYVVVSINANRGITCGKGVETDKSLNLARGRLVLKHLQRLSEWNRGVSPTPDSLGVSLVNKLELETVGLLGHSRGGEAMRAAYNLYASDDIPWAARIGTLVFAGIFEIGPVDGTTPRTLDSVGTSWATLLPMCDGDVAKLSGVKPFDRMMRAFNEDPPTSKATFTVWGANHNFYNTEWQTSESTGCTDHMSIFTTGSGVTGSEKQRTTGIASIAAFFLGNVGVDSNADYNRNFDPRYALPDAITSITRVDRGYSESASTDASSGGPTTVLEDFTGPVGTSTYGVPNLKSGITIAHSKIDEHDDSLRAAAIDWTAPGAATYFQSNWAASGAGFDLSMQVTLDLRIDRQAHVYNPTEATNFSVRLVGADDTLSIPAQIKDYVDLVGPVGGPRSIHTMLQTARIPLTAFTGVDMTKVRGVRVTFDDTATGSIFIANIRLSRLVPPTNSALMSSPRGPSGESFLATTPSPLEAGPEIATGDVRDVRISSPTGTEQGPQVELDIASDRIFEPHDELTVLRIGDVDIDLSRPGAHGDLGSITFRAPLASFARLQGGEPMTVQYGRGASSVSGVRWDLGRFDRARIPQTLR